MENSDDRLQLSRSNVKKKAIITLVIGCVLTCDGLMSLLSLLLLPSLEKLYESMNIAFDVETSKITLIVRGVICLTIGISLLIVSLLSYRKMKRMPADPVSESNSFDASSEGADEKETFEPEVVRPAAESNAERDYSSRLKELDQLHQDGLVSDAEYLRKRAEILRDAGY